MILLDSDHISILKYSGSERARRLVDRLAAARETVATTIITIEEQMRGWLAVIAKERQPARQVRCYRELADLFTFYGSFVIAAFDDRAAERFEGLAKIRIGSGDRKIAAIALTTGALLLTANRQDFEKVPGLRFASWLDE